MWITVALNKRAIKIGEYGGLYIDGEDVETLEIFDNDKKILEKDNFMLNMWKDLNAMFDWGDCDYFNYEKCKIFYDWLNKKLKNDMNEHLKELYLGMAHLAQIAIENETGMSFNF